MYFILFKPRCKNKLYKKKWALKRLIMGLFLFIKMDFESTLMESQEVIFLILINANNKAINASLVHENL